MKLPFKDALAGAAKFWGAAAKQETIWRAFMAAMVAMVLVYRLELGAAIYAQVTQITRLQPAAVPAGKFLAATLHDFTFVAGLGLVYLGLKILVRRWWPRPAAGAFLKIGEGLLVTGLLLTLSLVHRLHYQLLLQLDTGLTLDFVKTAPAMVGVGDFFRMLSWPDAASILAPVLVFILACLFARTWRRMCGWVLLFWTAFVLGAQLAGPQTLDDDLTVNPAVYFLSDAVKDQLHFLERENGYYARRTDMPGEEQSKSVRLVDEAFMNPGPRPPAPRREPVLTADGKSWNILFFVLESSGSDYIFDTSLDNPTPMPFLQKMTREGLYLGNHHASANNTAKAAFSIFTGLYPSTAYKNFAMEDNVAIPTLNRYLPVEYDYFLIHPTAPGFAFPQYLFLNNGLHDFYNQETLPPDRDPSPNNEARNEIDCFDFLMTRLDNAREPFLGVYWSFIPHFPYLDYGPESRILPGVTKRQAYYNNLHTLDIQLQRVYEHLVKTGMADRTLLVIVGDHGEAFGQHPRVWAHTFGFNSEMFRAPVLFWQPKLVSPQVVKFPTSHVDILPTLLDILGLPYDASRFQGESVLRGTPRRKYIFTMDAHSDYLSAISPEMNKVTLGFHDNYFSAFNLAKDPGENLPLDENRFWPQAEAIIKFRNYQSRMINDYNEARLAGRPYPPMEEEPAAP